MFSSLLNKTANLFLGWLLFFSVLLLGSWLINRSSISRIGFGPLFEEPLIQISHHLLPDCFWVLTSSSSPNKIICAGSSLSLIVASSLLPTATHRHPSKLPPIKPKEIHT
ncbi:hypothetical protein ACOSQ3_020464 [Xanthoceras sorbifolium]